MQAETWKDILAVLVSVILADQKVYKEEVDAFLDLTVQLNDRISPDILMTRKMAFDWFVQNRHAMETLIGGDDMNEQMGLLLERLKPLSALEDILSAMVIISEVGGEVHVNERALIIQAAKCWGLPVPGQD